MLSLFLMETTPPCNFEISEPVEIALGLAVVTMARAGRNCHLLVSEGNSLLINCLEGLTPAEIERAGYPVPGEIWHTQVDNRLAAEGNFFADAAIRLPREFAEVAAASPEYWKEAHATWDHPERWMEELGRQAYGIAGSNILQPLEKPLTAFHTFARGEMLSWRHFTFEVLDFSVRQFYAVGFALRLDRKVIALFCGELVDGNGNLPDAHGFEADYSGPPWKHISSTIRMAAARKPQWLFSAIGKPSGEATALLDQLADRIESYLHSRITEGEPTAPTPPRFERYHDHGESVYQMAVNYGNVILLVDRDGHGLMIDPGPCDFENPTRSQDFIEDLEKFESLAGLKTIDLVLVTHFHGDHYDLWPLVKDRYAGCRLAAWLPVADILRSPKSYPYACLMPWYDLGWTDCPVDVEMTRQQPLVWHDTPIHTVYLPGHCLAHAGYWLDWGTRRILFSGDSIQTRGGVDDLQLLMSNHSVPGTSEGHSTAYQNVIPLDITLNLGGHGSYFADCERIYRSSLHKINETTSRLIDLFGDRDPDEIFVRESLQTAAQKVRAVMTKS